MKALEFDTEENDNDRETCASEKADAMNDCCEIVIEG